MKLRLAIASAAIMASACSAPAQLPDMASAETLERGGEYDRALVAYERAQVSCKTLGKPRRRRAACAGAHTGRAELLERMGRRAEAADAYDAIPGALPDDPITGARGVFNAGRLRLALGQDKAAYTRLWRTVTEYPDEPFAADALKLILADARRRGAAAHLYRSIIALLGPLAGTGVSDNLLFAAASLAEKQFEDTKAALAYYDRLGAAKYRLSGLHDDALWHGARLARARGDARGAVKRLEQLLATREVSFGVGSYFSVWLDNAQLELGRVLRDDLADYKAARAAFERLPRHYPASVLRDDALFELAVTEDRAGQVARACKALAALRRAWPDSKYELERAPGLRRKLHCKI